MKKIILIILVLIFSGYVIRLLQVESNREYSVGGLIRVIRDVNGAGNNIRLWGNGIGCAYWLRLKNCLGIEVLGEKADGVVVKMLIPNIRESVDDFCSLVEIKYPREKYFLKRGELAKEFDPALGRAYQTFFDCENSRRAIGEIRIYANPSGVPTEKPEWIINPKLTKIFPIEQGE